MSYMIKLLILYAAIFSTFAQAESALPEGVTQALKKIALNENEVSIYVQALAAKPSALNPALLQHQATRALNPASTMKLVTSYGALAMLGPNYRWKTDIYTDGVLQNGVLNGNLYIKGYGDPNLTADDFNRLLRTLYNGGVRKISGDLVIDNSYFASVSPPAGKFDNEPLRAYNATPNAFLVNAKTTSFRFDADANVVNVSAEPLMPEIKIVNQLKVKTGDCNGWRSNLTYDFAQQNTGLQNMSAVVTLSGNYPANCAEKYLELVVLDENTYHLSLFKSLWASLGGGFNGNLRLQTVPVNAQKMMQYESQTLAQMLPDMNKWSNNLMARQLLLTIAAEKIGAPASEPNSALAVSNWLKSEGLSFNELVIENGAGLSRIERISTAHMGQMLVNAYYSPMMPELIASLPISALDGTMKKRLEGSELTGRAHLKTGSLNGVFALAGYVLAQSGERYAVVFMVNHAKAGLTKPVQDALLEWVFLQ